MVLEEVRDAELPRRLLARPAPDPDLDADDGQRRVGLHEQRQPVLKPHHAPRQSHLRRGRPRGPGLLGVMGRRREEEERGQSYA